MRALVSEIKLKAAFTPAIGADLKIMVAAPTTDSDPPSLTVTNSQSGHVTFKWTKQGWTGVKVQGKMPTQALWTDLGTDLFSPWVDTRPLAVPGTPEVREYRMCHLDGDASLENWSPAYSVTVTQ